MAREKAIAVTTTPTLDGFETKAYLDVVSAHVVAGTNLFSDLFASLSDIFGGRSHTYQKQLAAINGEAVELLERKTASLGGNCILGLRIDHDEISGGGKSMLMVTAAGTAAVAERVRPREVESLRSNSTVSADGLGLLMRRQRTVEAAESGRLRFDDETWEFLCTNQVHEVAPVVVLAVKQNLGEGQSADGPFVQRSKAYFGSIPAESAKSHLYPLLTDENPEVRRYALDVISELNLLDFDKAEEMIRAEELETQKCALRVLTLDKPSYAKADVERLVGLRGLVSKCFPVRGREVEVRRAFSSKARKRWECLCGAKVPTGLPNCPKCGRDIYGFRPSEVGPSHVEKLLGRKIAALERAFAADAAE